MMASTICTEEKRSRTASDKAKQKRINGHQNVCFTCRGSDDQLVKCSFCPCSYHMKCLPADTVITKPRWGCPAHKCSVCLAKTSSSRGKIYRCIGCPRAFCFNHTPQGSTVLNTNPLEELYGYATGSFVFIVCTDCQDKNAPLIASVKDDPAERKVLVKSSANNGKSEENSLSEESPPLAVLPKPRKRSLESTEQDRIPKKIKIEATQLRNVSNVNSPATRQQYSNTGSAPQYLYNNIPASYESRTWAEYSEAERQADYFSPSTGQLPHAVPSYGFTNSIIEAQPTIAPIGLSYYPQYTLQQPHQDTYHQSVQHQHYQYSVQPVTVTNQNTYAQMHYSPALLSMSLNPLGGVSHPLTSEVAEYSTRLESFRPANN